MIKSAYVCVISLAVGAGAGWALRGTSESSGTAAEPVSFSAASPFASRPRSASGEIDVTQLRAVFREELMTALASGPVAGQSTAAVIKAPPAPETAELAAQRRDAVLEIDAMVDSGQWGNEERNAFRDRLTMLNPEQADGVLQRVAQAFNNGTLQVLTDGPPL